MQVVYYQSTNDSLVWLSIKWLLNSPLDNASLFLHIEQFWNSSTIYINLCSHLGCTEYTVSSIISAYGPNLPQIWHFDVGTTIYDSILRSLLLPFLIHKVSLIILTIWSKYRSRYTKISKIWSRSNPSFKPTILFKYKNSESICQLKWLVKEYVYVIRLRNLLEQVVILLDRNVARSVSYS